jgi:hypothetical protein
MDVIFKRNQNSDWSFRGSAPDGLTAVGDTVTVVAREAPQFFYGDSQIERILQMRVTSISVNDDWVRGLITLPPHTYQQSNNGGKPWAAQFTGCCRFTDFKNNAGSQWAIVADIDLNKATRSPRTSVLPIVTVPYHPTSNPKPTFYVAVDEPSKVQWALGKPAVVGGAVQFTSSKSAYMSVPLSKLTDPTQAAAGNCSITSSAPACIATLLAGVKDSAITVEGWVKPMEAGGYVFSTGMGDAACSETAPQEKVRKCSIAAMWVHPIHIHFFVSADAVHKNTHWFHLCRALLPVPVCCRSSSSLTSHHLFASSLHTSHGLFARILLEYACCFLAFSALFPKCTI